MRRLCALSMPIASLALFAACSGGSVPMPQSSQGTGPAGRTAFGSAFSRVKTETIPKRIGWLSQRAKRSHKLVYVADGITNQILVYPLGEASPQPIGALTDGISEPEGMWVDRHGSLWVANTGTNTVEAFFHNHTKPYLIISQGGFGSTVDVVLDRYGNAYVAGLSGTVTEYAHGTTTPIETVTTGLYTPIAMTFDKRGFLLVTNVTPFNTSDILRFAPGSTYGVQVPIEFPGTRIGGILFDDRGNTYIADQRDNEILIYAHGSMTPTSEITEGIANPTFIAFDKDFNLYVTDAFSYPPEITVYAHGGSYPIETISTGIAYAVYGVAVWSDKY